MIKNYLFIILDAPSTTTSDLHLLLNDLTNDKNQQKKHNDTFDVDNTKVYGDIEDDLALILNDKQPQQVPKSIELHNDDDDHQQQSK